MSIKIQITTEDIQAGVPMTHDKCAIARAMQRMGYSQVTVSRHQISGYKDNTYISGTPPTEVQYWIRKFDCPIYPESRGLNMNPIEFELNDCDVYTNITTNTEG